MEKIDLKRSWWFFSFLVLLNFFLALSAIKGTWIYDDFTMINHPLMDGWDDVTLSFYRNSDDYLYLEGIRFMKFSPTYRPLSMASLIIINVLFGYNALAHHLFSFILHCAVFMMLFYLWTEGKARVGSWCILGGVFMLHPSLYEAYAWINGRSDLMAGLLWVSLLWRLMKKEKRFDMENTRQPPIIFDFLLTYFLALCGLFSKSVFLLGAATILVALSIPQSWAGGVRGFYSNVIRRLFFFRVDFIAFFAALLSYSFFKSNSGEFHVSTRVTVFDLLDKNIVMKIPLLISRIVGTMGDASSHAMRLLAWELSRPWTFTDSIFLIFMGLIIMFFVFQRRWRALVWIVGAFATVFPVIFVSEHLWLGFDRYLYIPICMISLPFIDLWAKLEDEFVYFKKAGYALTLGLLSLVSFAGLLTAMNYQSQETFVTSMITTRPEDPTGYLFVAKELLSRRDPSLIDYMDRVPFSEDTPGVMTYYHAGYDFAIDQEQRAMTHFQESFKRNPENLYLRVMFLDILMKNYRFEEAFVLSEELLKEPLICEYVADVLGKWTEQPEYMDIDNKDRFLVLIFENKQCY